MTQVRVYCEDCEGYKFTDQETIDPDWVPDGCETHTIRDFSVMTNPV